MVQLPEEIIGKNLHDLGLGKEFLGMTPKEQNIKERKTGKLVLSKLKTFALQNTVQRMKRQATD